jgi:hypothetical protein
MGITGKDSEGGGMGEWGGGEEEGVRGREREGTFARAGWDITAATTLWDMPLLSSCSGRPG